MDLDDILRKMKVQHKKRYESMLFDYKTTPRTDFRNGHNWEPTLKNEYKKPVRVQKTWPYPLRETQTMTDWKDAGPVPFDLFIKPKEIIRTDPRDIQKYFDAELDDEREMVRQTRPRVVMSPACKIDDADKHKLKVLLKDIYSSVTHKDMRDGIARIEPANPVAAPLVPVPAPTVPIKIEKYKPNEVPPEWRMDSASWEGRQLRSHCEPNKEFWIRPRGPQNIAGNGLY